MLKEINLIELNEKMYSSQSDENMWIGVMDPTCKLSFLAESYDIESYEWLTEDYKGEIINMIKFSKFHDDSRSVIMVINISFIENLEEKETFIQKIDSLDNKIEEILIINI